MNVSLSQPIIPIPKLRWAPQPYSVTRHFDIDDIAVLQALAPYDSWFIRKLGPGPVFEGTTEQREAKLRFMPDRVARDGAWLDPRMRHIVLPLSTYPTLKEAQDEVAEWIARCTTRLAVHEAGHAVAMIDLHLWFSKIEIATDGTLRGMIKSRELQEVLAHHEDERTPKRAGESVFPRYMFSGNRRLLLERYAVAYLAGKAAEEVWRGYSLDSFTFTGCESDSESVAAILEKLRPDTFARWSSEKEFSDAYMAILRMRAEALVIEQWKWIEAVARKLARAGTIDMAEADHTGCNTHTPHRRGKLRA